MTEPGAKAALRARLLAARRALTPSAREQAAAAITATVLDLPEVASARCVAAYHSFGTEPATPALLAGLVARKVRVLVPDLLPDLDLDWAIYDPPPQPDPGREGLWTPEGPRLGVAAVAAADVVIVPALAVSTGGVRLGRGGGSYDRALARVPPGHAVIALLYDGELLPDLPAEPHDQPVTHVVQPGGVHHVSSGAR